MFSPYWRTQFESKDFRNKMNDAIATSLQYTHMVLHMTKGCYFQEFLSDTPNVPSYSIDGTQIHWYQDIPEYNAQVYVVGDYGEPLVLAHDCGKNAFHISKFRWFGFYTPETRRSRSDLVVIYDKILTKALIDAIAPLEFPNEIRGNGFYSKMIDYVVSYCPVSKTLFVPYEHAHKISELSYLYRKIDGFIPFDINSLIKSSELQIALQSAIEEEQIIHYELTKEEIEQYS